ncbi:MAG TPA: glutamate--tRNA ligase, partial [Thermodesulfobacteriota bacterium]|nr:glutamate--tRNA ligase [Thermodesulfobacteriota bacterium]
LMWLNGLYIRQEKPERLAELLVPFLEVRNLKIRSMAWLAEVTATLRERAKTLVEMADQAEFYFRDDFPFDEKAEKKHLTPAIREPLETLLGRLSSAGEIDEKSLEEMFKEIAAARNLKLGAIAQAVRVSLTGKSVSPGIYEIIKILGKDEVLKRLDRAVKKL